jgi:hypothetical protein
MVNRSNTLLRAVLAARRSRPPKATSYLLAAAHTLRGP